MLTSRKWVERFGGSFHADMSTGTLIWAALRTDEANLIDLIKFGRGNRFSLNQLWQELRELDIDDTVLSFKTPIIFLLGRYDWQVPAVLAARYFERIEAPMKRLIWFEQSAHNPPFEEPEVFDRTLVELLKPLVSPAAQGRPSLSHGHAVHDDGPRDLAPVRIGISPAVVDDAAGDHRHHAGSIRRHEIAKVRSRARRQIDPLDRQRHGRR